MTSTGLEDAYNTLNLGLEGRKAFDRYFVFTEPSAASELGQRISIDKEPSKTILTGIKGCGKSTELLRLLRELDDRYFGVYVPIKAHAEVRRITALDILLASLFHLYITACERGVPLNERATKELATWLHEALPSAKVDFEGAKLEQKGLGDTVKKAINALKAQRIRDAVQPSLEERKADLIERIDKLVYDVESATKKKVLLAVDDLDKLPLERARFIFTEGGELLAAPHCKVVYTVPYSLIHTNDFREVQRIFRKYVHQGPMVVQGKESKDGVAAMKDIVAKRMSLELLEGAALDMLIARTGGVVSDLLRLTSEACIKARTVGKEKIDDALVTEVLDEVRKDSSRTLGASDCTMLGTIHKTHIADYNETFLRLLDDGYILEYTGEEGSYNVHPLIMPVLKDRKVI